VKEKDDTCIWLPLPVSLLSLGHLEKLPTRRLPGLGACPRIAILFKIEEFSKNKHSHMFDIASIIF
jgi:hypothetical protein